MKSNTSFIVRSLVSVPSSLFSNLSSLFSILYLTPLFAGAQTIRVFDTPNEDLSFTLIANRFSDIANYVIPFLIGVAFVVIIWGIFRYVRSAGDAEQVVKGRMYIIYGVLALFMMLSFWGFVMIIHNSLFGD